MTLSVNNDQKLKLYNAFFVHPPDEPPLFLFKSDAIEFDSGKIIEVFVTPNVITTDPDLQSIDVEDRVCFLDGEKQLRFFKIYTQKNCQMECFSNFSSQICGCVPFDVVRDFDTPVCELYDYACVAELEYHVKFEQDIEKTKSCNCLQLCNSVKYEFEFIESRFSKLAFSITFYDFKFFYFSFFFLVTNQMKPSFILNSRILCTRHFVATGNLHSSIFSAMLEDFWDFSLEFQSCRFSK